MSLASMVDTRLSLQQAQDTHAIGSPDAAGIATNIINQITRWIPTETITIYVVLLALLAPLAGHSPSFTSRWVLFSIITAANPVVVLLLTMARTRGGAAFRFPVFEMTIASVAFAAWAFSLPDTPLSSISGYEIKWNTAILTGTTISIALLANALHKSPHLDQLRIPRPTGRAPRAGAADLPGTSAAPASMARGYGHRHGQS